MPARNSLIRHSQADIGQYPAFLPKLFINVLPFLNKHYYCLSSNVVMQLMSMQMLFSMNACKCKCFGVALTANALFTHLHIHLKQDNFDCFFYSNIYVIKNCKE